MIKVIATAFMMMFLVLGQAQKLGHLNSNELLIENPKIKAADQEVMNYQKTLEAELQAAITPFEQAYQEFVAKAQSQDFSAVQLQKEQEALTLREQQIQQMQRESQNKIMRKREELYAPVLLEVEQAVQALGKEQGYTMIFDASLGAILYGMDSQDITAEVKTRLGY
jgi:outer membrane protein